MQVCSFIKEVVCVKIGNLAFCLVYYLTGVHFRGELQHIGDVSEQKKSSVDQLELEKQVVSDCKDGLYIKRDDFTRLKSRCRNNINPPLKRQIDVWNRVFDL